MNKQSNLQMMLNNALACLYSSEKLEEEKAKKEKKNKISRKLKNYISEEERSIFSIFGNLMSRDCEYHYNKGDEWLVYKPQGTYSGEYDFLLEYYVVGIFPMYRIKDDKIEPYLKICLNKNLNR